LRQPPKLRAVRLIRLEHELPKLQMHPHHIRAERLHLRKIIFDGFPIALPEIFHEAVSISIIVAVRDEVGLGGGEEEGLGIGGEGDARLGGVAAEYGRTKEQQCRNCFHAIHGITSSSTKTPPSPPPAPPPSHPSR